MELINQLDTNGYLLLKNVLNVNNVYGAFQNGNVDYSTILNYINNDMLKTVNNKLNWKCDYIKFRVSDNNNSSDASTFHRDILPQKNVIIPSFTVLSYLDKTVMQIIPFSHKQLFIKNSDLFATYQNKIELTIEPNDMLIFYSTLLHRGIFTQKIKSRKLIQVFEVFPSTDLLLNYKSKSIHTMSNESYTKIMQCISKISPIIFFINLIGYSNAASGYGIMDDKHISADTIYISSDGGSARIIIKPDTLQILNKYIYNYEVTNLSDDYKDEFNYTCYTQKFIYYTTLFIVILILYCILFYYIFKTISGPSSYKYLNPQL